jgi:hypothetical protein
MERKRGERGARSVADAFLRRRRGEAGGGRVERGAMRWCEVGEGPSPTGNGWPAPARPWRAQVGGACGRMVGAETGEGGLLMAGPCATVQGGTAESHSLMCGLRSTVRVVAVEFV